MLRALVVLVAACGGDELYDRGGSCEGYDLDPVRPGHLADLDFRFKPYTFIYLGDANAAYAELDTSYVAISGGEYGAGDEHGSFCALLDVSVSLGALSTSTRVGGATCFTNGPGCVRYMIKRPIPYGEVPSTNLVFADESKSFSIPIGDLLAARTFAPLLRNDWTFHANERVTFTWEPASDFAIFDQVFVRFVTTNGIGEFEIPNMLHEGNTISVTFPNTTGAGRLAIRLSGGYVVRAGFGVQAYITSFHDITIVP